MTNGPMNATRSGKQGCLPLQSFLRTRIDAGDFPSAVYLVAENGNVVLHEALGDAVIVPERIAAERDTIYDLASVTKAAVTALLLAKLVEDGDLSLDDRLSDILGEGLNDLGRLTIRQIVTHTTGLPGWLPFYLLVADRKDIIQELANTPLGEPKVVYGDPNFWLLTFVIEKVLSEPITEAAQRLIFEPLQLLDTFYFPPSSKLRRIAASEKGNAFERQLCRDLGFEFTENRVTGAPGFRDDEIWGEVHDQNAWFFGNICGHAGLFSTAEELLKIAMQFLPATTSLLRPETCALFAADLTPDMDEHRSFCFELASTPNTTAGTLMSPQSFGHLGFTGTSLWIDPVMERIFILLTNRTHDHGLPLANINPVRRRFHDLAAQMLNK